MSEALHLALYGIGMTLIAGAFSYAYLIDRYARKIEKEFYEYKVQAALHFAAIAYVGAVEKRTVDALDDIKDGVKAQGDKLDRLIEKMIGGGK